MPGGSIALYDSSATATNQIANIGFGTPGAGVGGGWTVPIEVRVSSGITYTTSGNTTGVTIIYKETRPR